MLFPVDASIRNIGILDGRVVRLSCISTYICLYVSAAFYKIARNWCVQSVQQLLIIIECLGIRVQRPAHPSQLCRLRKSELNSREKYVRTNSLGDDIRYSSVSGRIATPNILTMNDSCSFRLMNTRKISP